MDAILEATIQVLLQVGKERLTTTKVALRAGVSVGTLYQYFPNKSALLKAALKRHMDEVTEAIERVCHEQKGKSLEQMATALMTTFLVAKMTDAKTSVALYAVSSDIDGEKIVQETGIKSNKAIVGMLKTAREQLTTDPQLVASMLQGVMVGVCRRLLESTAPEKQFDTLRQELIFIACAYLKGVFYSLILTRSQESSPSRGTGIPACALFGTKPGPDEMFRRSCPRIISIVNRILPIQSCAARKVE